MSVKRGRTSSNGRRAKILVGAVFVAAAFGVSKTPLPRRVTRSTVELTRAWSKRQRNRALQAPVIRSQGERWRAMRPTP
jgi:hypothetical protein